jgi:hypothetical protein
MPRIEKKDAVMRDAVSAEKILLVISRYLATGSTYQYLKLSSATCLQLLSWIVPKTTLARQSITVTTFYEKY